MEPADVVKTAFAMPLTSPSFARGPYRYLNREYLVITYRTDRAALEALVPEPLTIDEPLVRCEFMRMESSTGVRALLGRGAAHPRQAQRPGRHRTHLICISTPTPRSPAGASCGGFRKSSPSRNWRWSTTPWSAPSPTVPSRSPAGPWATSTAPSTDEPVLRIFDEPNFLLKIIPHVDGKPRICELVRYDRRDVVLHGAWTAPCALELHPHALAPLADLPVIEIVSGVHMITDFTLPHGEVVHDYLA